MRIRQLYNLIALVAAVLAVQVFLSSQVLAATTYVSQAVVVSTNLLSGSSASSITNFHYNIASLPVSSSVRIQFSKDNTNWYSTTGTLGAWTTISAIGGADLSLTDFVTAASWTSGNSFYYKLELNATPDQTQTPALEDIRLDYSLVSGYEKTFVFDSAGNVGIGTASPGYKLDIAVTANDRGINIANTATQGINYGVYSAATGASTVNYGGYFQSIGAASNYGLGVAPMTGTTSVGLNIGTLSGATANTGINIGNISGGASTNYGINLGDLTGGTGSSGYQINTGNIVAIASGNWGGINLGTRSPATAAITYGINIGNTLAGAGTATYGINIGANTSAATNNYGLKIGAISGAGTTNTGLYVDTVSGAGTNYAAIFAGGNVGIGTTTPLSKLDVWGDLVLSGSNRYLNFGNTTGTIGYGIYDNGGTIQFKNSGGAWTNISTSTVAYGLAGQTLYYATNGNAISATSALFILPSGNVGIGTTTLDYALEVAGTFGVTPAVGNSPFVITANNTFPYISTGFLDIYDGDITILNNIRALGMSIQMNESEKMRITGTGSVGINSSTPIAKLGVQGLATEGSLPLLDIASSTGASLLRVTSGGNVGIGTESPNATLQVGAGTPQYNGQFDIWGVNKIFAAGANVTIYSNDAATINMGGSIAFGGAHNGGGGPYPFGIVAGRLENTTNWAGYLQFATTRGNSSVTEKMRITSEGSVGINSTTPVAVLAVQANAANSTTPLFDISSSSVGSSYLRVLANGNVGIGTSSPIQKLDVVGTVLADGITAGRGVGDASAYLVTDAGTTGSNQDSGLSFRVNSTEKSRWFIWGSPSSQTSFLDIPAGGLQIRQYGGAFPTYMTVANTGNVGIGTTSPYAKLSITSAGITSSTLAFAVDNASSTQLMRIDDAGNVSMGGDGFYYDASTTVSHLNAEFGSMSFDEDAGIVSWINLPFVSTTIPQGTQMSYSAQINNTDILTIYGETNGSGGLQYPRVGIGTTTPNAKLTVYSDTIATSSNALTVYNASSTRLLKVTDSGDISFGNADGLYYEASSSVTYVNSLQTGPQSFDDDAGIISWINLPITTTTAGIVNSYSAQMAGNDVLTVYGVTDGAGGITSTQVGINSSTPMATLAVQGAASSLPVLDIASSTGSSLLRVLANGNVGIGTTNPGAILDSYHTNNGAGLQLSRDGYGIGSYNDINFYEGSSSLVKGKIRHIATASGQFDLQFFTGSAGGVGATPELSLQAGKVGINSTSPIAQLGVQGQASSLPVLDIASSTGASLLRVLANGNVGVGTESPGGLLDVRKDEIYAANTLGGITVGGSSTNKVLTMGFDTTNNFGWINAVQTGSAIMPLVLNPQGGKVGVNSTSPIAQLSVQSVAGSIPFDIASSTGASLLRVTAGGNVGIGTTSPTANLDVVGSFMVSGNTSIESTSNQAMTFHGNGGGIALGSNGQIQWDLTTNGGATNKDIGIVRHGVGSLEINQAVAGQFGDLFLRSLFTTSSVGIGTTTPLARLTIQGATIATSSNALTVYNASSTQLFKIADSGDISMGSASGFYYEASTSISYVNSLETGGLNFDDNAGLVSWVDMTVDSVATTGTPEGYTASINGNPMILVYGDSAGDGTVANMTVSIGTSTTSTYKLYIDAGGSANAGLGVNGYIKSSGFIAGTTTLDLAETYPLDPNCSALGNCPAAGDVVCAISRNVNIQIPDPSNPSSTIDTVNTLFVIEKCSATSTENAIGVVSANPGFVLGGYDLNDTIKSKNPGLYPSTYQPVALSGRVPVNVSLENGPIKAGDLLTSSAQPGVAVKAVEPGRVIGVALEAYSATSTVPSTAPTIKMFVNPHWSVGSLTEEQISNELPDFSVGGILDSFSVAVENSLRKLGMLLKNGVATVKQLFADKVQTNQLCVGATCVNEQQLQDLLNKTNIQPAAPAPVVESAPTPTTTEPVVETPSTTPPVTEPAPTEPAPVVEPTPAPVSEPAPVEPAPVVEPTPAPVPEPAPAPEPTPTPAPVDTTVTL